MVLTSIFQMPGFLDNLSKDKSFIFQVRLKITRLLDSDCSWLTLGSFINDFFYIIKD